MNSKFIKESPLNCPMEFPANLKENFLKILTNVFFLNVRKVIQELKKNNFEIYKNHSKEQILEKIITLYDDNLKETRRTVVAFFGIERQKYFSQKVLIRYYAYSLDLDDPVRTKYKQYSANLTKIEENLAENKFPTELLDESSELISGPIDVIYF